MTESIKAKSYPDLNLQVERAGVRMLRGTLKIVTPTKLVTAHVRAALLICLDQKLKQVEKETGLCCPCGFEDKYGFDEQVGVFEHELCDVEQFALRHMLIIGLKSYDMVRYIPNHHLLSEVFLKLDTHVLENGGYDQSTSADNLTSLHSESKKIERYLREQLPSREPRLRATQERSIIARIRDMFTGRDD